MEACIKKYRECMDECVKTGCFEDGLDIECQWIMRDCLAKRGEGYEGD